MMTFAGILTGLIILFLINSIVEGKRSIKNNKKLIDNLKKLEDDRL